LGEQHRIETRTKPNHSWLNSGRLTISGNYSRSPYVVIVAEVLAGIALVLGVWTRVVAIASAPILLGAIFAVHGAAGFFFSNPQGGWEYPAFWTVALIVQALLGDGALALRTSRADGFAGEFSGASSR
jgi:putative oxidoreductase